MHIVQRAMMNWRLVRRLRTGILERVGNKERMTWGSVSPIMMPNAHMPKRADKNWVDVKENMDATNLRMQM